MNDSRPKGLFHERKLENFGRVNYFFKLSVIWSPHPFSPIFTAQFLKNENGHFENAIEKKKADTGRLDDKPVD